MWIIDRFEGDFAVVESGDIVFNIPVSVLPEDCSEGAVLHVVIDSSAESSKRVQARSMMDSLFNK